jgi:hypothetical protein
MPYNSVVGRSDVAGIIPVEYSNELIGLAESETSHVLRLGRALRRMSVRERKLPVMSALATAYFLPGDTDLVHTSEVNWADVMVTAEDLAVLVPIPKNVLNDASIPLWSQIQPEIATAVGVAVDNAVLYGTNKPSTWPTDIVAGATAASNVIEKGSGTDLYAEILGEGGVFSFVELSGFGISGSIGHLSLKGALRGTRDANGQPIFTRDPVVAQQYNIDGVVIEFPMNGAGNSSYPLISGDWSQLVYSIREDMEFEVFTQGVITDAAGNIVYNLMQQRMAAIMVVMRLGFALPNPINRVDQTSSRYPFAVLTDLV